MVSVVRCWKAEYQKCKHSILLYMHSMIPIICAAIFAGYYHISRWELATKISAYLEVLAVAFPFLIGIIVGLVVQIENQAGHYQLLLGTIPSRMATYIGKLGFLMICAFGATFLALGTFAALYRDAPASLYLKAGILLLITMLPIYLIHLFVGMSFGKGASMGLGIAGSLIAALMITGLGDATWKYIPWAWGVRAMDYTVLAWNSPQLYAQVKTDFFSGMIISVCCTVCLLIASLVWFHGWEEVKTVNKKCLFAVVIVLVSLICLSACGALRDTADKNKALNKSLPYYELNAANYDEISYNGLTYTITDECLEMSELQEEIGQVSKRFKNVAGEDFSFGYVYSIVDVDISNAVAVNINNEYRKADIKNNDE